MRVGGSAGGLSLVDISGPSAVAALVRLLPTPRYPVIILKCPRPEQAPSPRVRSPDELRPQEWTWVLAVLRNMRIPVTPRGLVTRAVIAEAGRLLGPSCTGAQRSPLFSLLPDTVGGLLSVIGSCTGSFDRKATVLVVMILVATLFAVEVALWRHGNSARQRAHTERAAALRH